MSLLFEMVLLCHCVEFFQKFILVEIQFCVDVCCQGFHHLVIDCFLSLGVQVERVHQVHVDVTHGQNLLRISSQFLVRHVNLTKAGSFQVMATNIYVSEMSQLS